MFRFIDNNNNIDTENKDFDILNYDDVILNLKILSKIKEKEKLIISNKLFNIDKRYFQPLIRHITDDNRDDTIRHINLILLHCFKFLDDTTMNTENSESLVEELKKSISGLSCLKFTYKDDEVIGSKLDLLIDKIKEKVIKKNTINLTGSDFTNNSDDNIQYS
tara:strand:+ start:1853 stop:2341 length:489 start_codon:yes stop_codon:yes gene_type:complete